MKKIGILTTNGNSNVGNKLQNYALLTYLESLNFKVNTIWFTTPKRIIKHYIKLSLFFIPKFKNYAYFYKFTKNNLHVKYYLDTKIEKEYDNFIVGSDQVWNYKFDDLTDKHFLGFSKRSKNSSYAASIGSDIIPDEYKKIFIEGLKNLEHISVREEKAKELLEEISHRKDIEVLLDPTMLLSQNEWDKLLKKSKALNLPKNYIFTYFLGDCDEEYAQSIEKVAKQYNYEIIDFHKLQKTDTVGPAEFLYLEKNANLICTDSFHSSVFSIIFNKPFVIFNRRQLNITNMGSRIDTLLSKLNIKNRRFSGEINEQHLKCDYTDAYKILEKEREKSYEFLNNALK